MEIYLIRHTKVNIDRNICYGATDVDLADEYLNEFKRLKARLGDLSSTHIYSSALKRCTMLAEYLSKNNFLTDERINELNFGHWEMMPWDKIDQAPFNEWMQNFENIKPPEGESFNDLYARTVGFFKEILNNEHNKTVIISHSGPIKTIISHILEIPLRRAISIDIDYGSISRIEKRYNYLRILEINI